jgi:hypothetical protein
LDLEMRHGRKSASKLFNGHKAAVAVDIESQLIGGVEVLAGNAGDQEKALDLVHQIERVMEVKVEETVGTRQNKGDSPLQRPPPSQTLAFWAPFLLSWPDSSLATSQLGRGR